MCVPCWPGVISPGFRRKEQELRGWTLCRSACVGRCWAVRALSGGLGAGAALRGWVAVAEQKSDLGCFGLGGLRESQAASGSMGQVFGLAVAKWMRLKSLNPSGILFPIHKLELPVLTGDTDPFLHPRPMGSCSPGSQGGVRAWSSTRGSCPGAPKLPFPYPEGRGNEVGSSAGVLARQLHLLFVAVSLLLVFPGL